MKLLKSIKSFFQNFYDWLNRYELTRDDLDHLSEIVENAKLPIDFAHHRELMDRAKQGNNQALDILMKDKDIRINMSHKLDIRDTVVVEFTSPVMHHGYLEILSEVSVHAWLDLGDNKIAMKFWVFMEHFHGHFGEAVAQPFKNQITIIRDDEFLS